MHADNCENEGCGLIALHGGACLVSLQRHRDALAEVARLREALERISAILPCSEPCEPRVICGTCHRGDDTNGEIDCTGCIARAALGRAP